MADKKISQLDDGITPQSGDELIIARAGDNYRISWDEILSALPIQRATITLTDDQIKTLPSVSSSLPYGQVILASPGSGKAYLLVSGIVIRYGVAYTNVDSESKLVFAYENFNTSNQSPEILCGGGGFLDINQPQSAVIPLTGWHIDSTSGFPDGLVPISSGFSLFEIENKGLILNVGNGSNGNFTGGGVNNRLDIHLLYAVLDV